MRACRNERLRASESELAAPLRAYSSIRREHARIRQDAVRIACIAKNRLGRRACLRNDIRGKSGRYSFKFGSGACFIADDDNANLGSVLSFEFRQGREFESAWRAGRRVIDLQQRGIVRRKRGWAHICDTLDNG